MFPSRSLNLFRASPGQVRHCCSRKTGGRITALVDMGCIWSSREVETMQARAKEQKIDEIKIVNVYDKRYNPADYQNISRKAAMREFYLIKQDGKILKNFDAVLYLFNHTDRKVHTLLNLCYYPLNYLFLRVWLPIRLSIWARDDVRLEIEDEERHREFFRSKTKRVGPGK